MFGITFYVIWQGETLKICTAPLDNGRWTYSIFHYGEPLHGYKFDDPLRRDYESEEEAAKTAVSMILWP